MRTGEFRPACCPKLVHAGFLRHRMRIIMLRFSGQYCDYRNVTVGLAVQSKEARLNDWTTIPAPDNGELP